MPEKSGQTNPLAIQTASHNPWQETQSADQWEIAGVMRELEMESGQQELDPSAERPWWTDHVLRPIDRAAQPVEVNVGDLVLLALEYSAKVSVARDLPLIRETAIGDAEAAFDWHQFIDSRWADTSEPVGNQLTVGGTGTRFREHDYSIDIGMRRKLLNGADFNLYQQLGHRNNNSTFFTPNDQATSRIVLGFTQPLLRGRGQVYNTSLILLAQIDTESAQDEFHRQLQSHLLEVARSYWALYLERADLAQKVSLYLKTKTIAEQLKSRAGLDAQRTQIISANAALESRRSELIRSRAAVKNAETRLRALLNAPGLESDAEMMELIPNEHPTQVAYPVDLPAEFEIALQNRPEIAAAMKGIRSASVRLEMAEHEILPMLNLVTEAYVSGLRGNSDIGNAWVDQFRVGEPGYSIGIQYEIPLGRRAAFSNQRRRQIEIHQMQEQYRSSLELVKAEVEIAVRELRTAYRELNAKQRSRLAAEAEAETLETRWKELGDQGSTGGLLLESLLRAQERVTQYEFEFAKAQMTYNLALINLRHANGTLYQTVQTDSEIIGQPEVVPTDVPESPPVDSTPSDLTPSQTSPLNSQAESSVTWDSKTTNHSSIDSPPRQASLDQGLYFDGNDMLGNEQPTKQQKNTADLSAGQKTSDVVDQSIPQEAGNTNPKLQTASPGNGTAAILNYRNPIVKIKQPRSQTPVQQAKHTEPQNSERRIR